MNNFPLVSVIIPNYNHARYLEQRLYSVFNQTYQNFEVIILDDCSTDNSMDVIEYFRNDPHTKYVVINEKNSGNTFMQWKKGINLAKGDIIWIAESDDFCELNMLEQLVSAFFKQKNTVLAYVNPCRVDENGKPYHIIKSCTPYPLFSKHGLSYNNIKEIAKSAYRKIKSSSRYFSGRSYIKHYLSIENAVCNASGAIFSRVAALNISDRYLSSKSAGDYYFWTELADKGNIAVINRPLSYFRTSQTSVTSVNNTNGNNMMSEKPIVDEIIQKYRIGRLRKFLIMASHSARCTYIPYINEEIRDSVYSLWNVNKYFGKSGQLFYRLHYFFRDYFNIWI